MSRFGGFETDREIFRSGLSALWSARRADASPDEPALYGVKEFRPLDSLPLDEADAAVEFFLEAAELQQRVAAAGAEHWAPIEEFGRCGSGAYYVSRHYHRSLSQLIASRVRFSATALASIAGAVVQGLRELREACDRPHGDIKPSNVLVETAGDITKTRVVLTDPLPTSQLPRTGGEEGDVRAVGRLLYRLVVHRRFEQLSSWPIAKSRDWRRMGGIGEAWRHLCERLLDPDAPAEQLTLDWLAGQVTRIARRKAVIVRLVAMGVAVVVLAVVGWLGYRYATRPSAPPVETFDLARWQRLCGAFYNWFGPLGGSLDADRKARWRRDPTLDRVVARLEAADAGGVALDPRQVADSPDAVLSEMGDKPPPGAQSPQGIRRTVAALKTIDDVRQLLGRQQWARLEATSDLAARWHAFGWHRPAACLDASVQAIDPPAGDDGPTMPAPQVVSHVDRLLAVHEDLLPAIEASHQTIRTAQKALGQSGDPILRQLDVYWRWAAASEPGEGSEEDLGRLRATLEELAAQATGLAAFVQGDWRTQVERDLFVQDSTVHRSFDGRVTKHIIRLWREEVRDYYRLPAAEDPRAVEDWAKRLTQIATDVATLKRAPGQGAELSAQYGERLASEVRPAVAELRKRPAVLRTKATLQKETAEVKAALDALAEDVARSIIAFMGKPREWLEGIGRFEFKGSAVINETWTQRRSQLLAGVTAEQLEAELERYGALRSKVDTLRGGLSALASDPELPTGLPQSAREYGSRRWYNAFAHEAAARREGALKTALGAVPWEDGVPQVDDAAFAARWETLRAGQRTWCEEAAAAIGALGTLEDALDACHLLDQTPPGLGQPLGRFADAWLGKPVLKATDLRKAVEPIAQRVAAVRTVGTLADRRAVAAQALRARPREVAFAAWRRLGTLEDPQWPASDAELAQDREIRARLATDLRLIRDTARRKALQDVIDQETARRLDLLLAQRNERLLQELRQAEAVIEGTGDRVLSQFGAFVDAQLGKARPRGNEALHQALMETKAIADRLKSFIQGEWAVNIDRAKFARLSQVHSGFDGTLTRETIEAWLREAPKFRTATAEEIIAKIRTIATLCESPAVNAEWAKRRDQVLSTYPVVLLQADAKLLATVRERLNALQGLLRGIDDVRELPKGLPAGAATQLAEPVQAALARVLAQHRERALAAAVSKVTWGGDGFPSVTLAAFKASDAWQTATQDYAGLRSGLVARVAKAQQLPVLLDAGYLPDDQPPGQPDTVRQLYAGWQELCKAAPALEEAVPGLDARMAPLLAIEGLKTRDQLVAGARALTGKEAPQAPFMLWRRLGKVPDWPATLDELPVESALRSAVASHARRLGAAHPEAVRWAGPALATEGTRRWEACFSRLVPQGEPTEADEARLSKAIEYLGSLQVDAKQLRPATLLRLYLRELRRELLALPDNAKREQAGELVAAFRRRVTALPEVGQRPELRQFLDQASEILKQGGAAGGASLASVGPGLYPHGGGWKPRATAGGVAYTWAQGQTIHFALVDASGGQGKPTYIGTTEVSLGLFMDVVASANQWREVMRLFKAYDVMDDTRRGPRVWELTRRGEAIQPSREWLFRRPGIDRPYPAGLEPGRPSREHPIQYVSPDAALFVARLLGCRLPTAAEWRAAAARVKGQPANLRDATWKRQQQHVVALHADRRHLDWPDAGIFLPVDAQARSEGEAALVSGGDDGHLWFAPVGEGSGLRDVVGNVAEFVFEAPAAVETALAPRKLSADAVRTVIDQHGKHLAVVGGSALSPPELWDGRQRPFGGAFPVALDMMRDGLSDVGFRLAFSAPIEATVATLKRLVRQQGYLATIR